MRVNISHILVRTPMHNVLLSVWMGLKTRAVTHIFFFYLLVLPMALWEFFLVPICGTAQGAWKPGHVAGLQQHCSNSLQCCCKRRRRALSKKQNRGGVKWKLNGPLIAIRVPSIWAGELFVSLFVCDFLCGDGLMLTHSTQHIQTGSTWILQLTTV